MRNRGKPLKAITISKKRPHRWRFFIIQSKGPLDVKLFPAWSILFGDRLKLNLRTRKK
jgi:hypothetical protein